MFQSLIVTLWYTILLLALPAVSQSTITRTDWVTTTILNKLSLSSSIKTSTISSSSVKAATSVPASSSVLSSSSSKTLSSKSNVAVYWGQGPSQQRLSHFCAQPGIDIIPIGFVNYFPAQGNGYAGTNFGNACFATTFAGPGYSGVNTPANNHLLASCPTIVADIPICQATYGKKIILSLGGGTQDYQLTGAADGIAFADFLWGAFGPQNATWVKAGLPRPFDAADGTAVVVDGFDFDIEYPSTDSSAGYIAMINRLRSRFNSYSGKQFLITGAPQCVTPDANMNAMLTATQFDILFVQFYNTGYCSARKYVDTGVGFTYNAWASLLVGTASANAKIYIGLPGSAAAAGYYSSSESYYLTPTEVASLVSSFYCDSHFGGIMIWEATYADGNLNNGLPYYQSVKNLLLAQDASVTCGSTKTTSANVVVVPSTLKTATAPIVSTGGSSTAKSTSPAAIQTSINFSTDGACGANGKTCPNSLCCSQYGYCGSGTPYCALPGCQIGFGTCSSSSSSIVSVLASVKSSSIQLRSSAVTISSALISASTSTKTPTTLLVTTKTTTTSTIPTSKPASSSPSTPSKPASVIVSNDGSCGASNGKTCPAGTCCSTSGYCGSGTPWCGVGNCQTSWSLGTCSS